MKRYVSLVAIAMFIVVCSSSTVHAQMMDDCAAHPDDELMHTEHCAVFALVPADGATHISVANGNWSSPSTWNTGTVPGAGAMVLIDSGFTVTYNLNSTTEVDWVRVKGTLNFSTVVSTQLMVVTLVIDPLGVMNIGTALTPVPAAVTSKIIFPDQGVIDISMDPFEFGKGLISHGLFTINGAYKKSYCGVTKNINAGASNIKLSETPTGWQVGDQIVVPGTYGTEAGDFIANSKFHDEVLTITLISGKTIYFSNNATGGTTLQYEHKMPAGYGLKMYVANLTRNVRIESENHTTIPISQRGHVMLMHNVAQSISNAAFIGLGRTNKDILVTDPIVNEFGEQIGGGSNVRGRYALHVHKAGTNNILAIPLLIKGCAVTDPTSWGIVNHESNVNVDDNVVFNYFGAAFITEDGNELGRFNRNMAIKGRKATIMTDLESRTANFDFGFEGNGFWMQSSNVSYENNIVTSSAGDAYKVFSDDASLPDAKRLKIPVANILNPMIAGTEDSIYTAVVPLRKFTGNIAYNCNSAMMFWTHMLNNDNVGDFSTIAYDPYTHTQLSVVDGFKFWNMLGAGISVKYSGQVHFKNGLLLGDINNQFQTSDWITGNPYGGFAFISSTVTGQMIYEGLTVKGWKRALIAGRADDLQSGDEMEYDYRTTKVIGGIYTNNMYNIVPEEGTDVYGASEYYKFPKYFEISGAPVFSTVLSNVSPLADYAYITAGGNAIQFNGILSLDSDPTVITSGQGNGIAAYVWNFGDGSSGFGADPVHVYTLPGTYSVTLTVYDCQGATASIAKNVYVATLPYANVIEHSGFETGTLSVTSYATSTRAFAGKGWLHKSNWQQLNGKAMIYLSDKWERPLTQITKNNRTLQGTAPFSFQAENTGLGAIGNDLYAEVIGVNGEFKDMQFTEAGTISKWNNNDPTFTATTLLYENFGLASFTWQTFTRNINFGSGYDYIIVKFYSEGVKVGPAEEQGIDNVCLPCNCTVPGGQFEVNLTPTNATLIWDNVGSTQYQVQYKTTIGGSWTTMTVENTYLPLLALLPNTSYIWKVKALCAGVWTSFSADKIFITPSAGGLCTSPNLLSTELITSSKATLVWNIIPGVIEYQVSYKPVAGAIWTDVITSASSLLVSGLLPATSYQWKVKAHCAGGWIDYTSIINFTTAPLREEELGGQAQILHVFPNPASDQVMISCDGLMGNVQLVNMAGQIVRNGMLASEQMTMQIGDMPPGIYILHISLEDGQQYSEKLIVE